MKDDLWEMLLHVCGYDPKEITASSRGWLNQGLKELREVHATPEELLLRARRYWDKFKRRPSPSAMSKHWASLGGTAPFSTPLESGPCEHLFPEEPEDSRGRYCVRCREWVPVVVQLRLIEGDIA